MDGIQDNISDKHTKQVLVGERLKATEKNIINKLDEVPVATEKMREPYFRTRGFMDIRSGVS